MLGQDNKTKPSQKAPLMPILFGGMAIAAAGGALFYVQNAGQQATEVVLTDAARAYLPNLDLNNVKMEATEDALGQTLLEVTGEITNLGQRTLTTVEANCIFRDVNGLEIERQRSAFINRRSGTLDPGKTHAFRMAFDDTPDGWNQILPDLYIAQIQFDD